MKTFTTLVTLATLATLATLSGVGFSSHALANPISPYDPAPVCKNGFVAAHLPDGTWRCLPRFH